MGKAKTGRDRQRGHGFEAQEQGDQIRRFFAQRVIVRFGQSGT
jgi:hypothetical protein